MNYQIFGDENAPYCAIAIHGFMATGESWAHLAHILGSNWCLYAPHITPETPEQATFDAVCGEIAELITAVAERRRTRHHTLPLLIGYSMGGRVCLELLHRFPHLPIGALLLESAGLGVAHEAEREDYTHRAHQWAQRFLTTPPHEYVQWWESLPIFATQKTLDTHTRRAQRAARLRIPPAVLAHTTIGLGQAHMHTVSDNCAALAAVSRRGVPVVYVAGQRDAKYVRLAHTLGDAVPEVQVRLVDAGHNIHLENLDEYAEILRSITNERALST